MATHSSILAWRIPWTEEPDRGPRGRKESDTTEQLHSLTHSIPTYPLISNVKTTHWGKVFFLSFMWLCSNSGVISYGPYLHNNFIIFVIYKITADDDCSHEIKRCLLLERKVMTLVMYRYESWTVKKAEHRNIDAFELWYWIRLLRGLWTTRRSNQSILKEISPGCLLEGLMLKLKLQYFGHLM